MALAIIIVIFVIIATIKIQDKMDRVRKEQESLAEKKRIWISKLGINTNESLWSKENIKLIENDITNSGVGALKYCRENNITYSAYYIARKRHNLFMVNK